MRFGKFFDVVKRIEMAESAIDVFKSEQGLFTMYTDTVAAHRTRRKGKATYIGSYKGVEGAKKFREDV